MIVTKKDGSTIIKVYFVQFKKDKIEAFIEGVEYPKEVNLSDLESIV